MSPYFESQKFMLYHNLINFITHLKEFKSFNDDVVTTTKGIELKFIDEDKTTYLEVNDPIGNNRTKIIVNIMDCSYSLMQPDNHPIKSIYEDMVNKIIALREDGTGERINEIVKRYNLKQEDRNTYVDSTNKLRIIRHIDDKSAFTILIKLDQDTTMNTLMININKYNIDTILDKIDKIIELSEDF